MGGRRSHQISPPWSPLSNTDYGDGWNTSEGATKEQDWHLPIANVGRIMKKSLPANAKISKEAKGVVQECVSEFIVLVTGEASDRCRREKRKTVNGDDLLWAMTTLGFESYAVYLGVYMDKYREAQGENSTAPMQGDLQSPVLEEGNHVAKEGDQSPMKEMIPRKNSPKPGLLINRSSVSSNPRSMQLSTINSPGQFYSLGALMGQGYVGGGDQVGGYGQDHSGLADFTITFGENNNIGDANVAADLAAYYHHGFAQGF